MGFPRLRTPSLINSWSDNMILDGIVCIITVRIPDTASVTSVVAWLLGVYRANPQVRLRHSTNAQWGPELLLHWPWITCCARPGTTGIPKTELYELGSMKLVKLLFLAFLELEWNLCDVLNKMANFLTAWPNIHHLIMTFNPSPYNDI